MAVRGRAGRQLAAAGRRSNDQHNPLTCTTLSFLGAVHPRFTLFLRRIGIGRN